MTDGGQRATAALRLLAVAVASGAAVGTFVAAFVWIVDEGIGLVWEDLADALDVAPFDSWFVLAVPIAGGLLVGLGQRFIGDVPEPIDHTVQKWRTGERIDPSLAPKSFVAALPPLLAGGPVGFEAALASLAGGSSTWIGDRLGPARRHLRQAWGVDEPEALSSELRHVPPIIAGLASLFVFRWLPFGALDMGFRLQPTDALPGVVDGLAALVLGLVLAVPVAAVFGVVVRAEEATIHRRAPELVAMLGGLVIGVLALGDDLILFSGQQGLNGLDGMTRPALVYVAVVKILALCVAFACGWRGGPVFPLWLSASALGALYADLLDLDRSTMAAAAIAAVAVVFLKGRVLAGLVLSLYAVPLAYAGALLIGAVGGAIAIWLSGREPAAPSASSHGHDDDRGDRCEGSSSG